MPAVREVLARTIGRRKTQQEAIVAQQRRGTERVLPEGMAGQVESIAQQEVARLRERIAAIDVEVDALGAQITAARRDMVAAAHVVERPAVARVSAATGQRREIPQRPALFRGQEAIDAGKELLRLGRRREGLLEQRIQALSEIADLEKIRAAARRGNTDLVLTLAGALRGPFGVVFPLAPKKRTDARGNALEPGDDGANLRGTRAEVERRAQEVPA